MDNNTELVHCTPMRHTVYTDLAIPFFLSGEKYGDRPLVVDNTSLVPRLHSSAFLAPCRPRFLHGVRKAGEWSLGTMLDYTT